MDVLFLAPTYPPEMRQYVRGLAEVGARVLGVGDTPREALPARLPRWPDRARAPLYDHERLLRSSNPLASQREDGDP